MSVALFDLGQRLRSLASQAATNFRLVQRLLAQIERIVAINDLVGRQNLERAQAARS